MELSRLLRRGLLVAAVAVAGWLLSVVFAASASADELPSQDSAPAHEQRPGGLLGGLLGGVTETVTGLTNTVVGLTGSVVDTTTTLLAPVVTPPPAPIVDLPELLPVPIVSGSAGSSSGSATTDRVAAPPVVAAPAPAPVVAPVAPPPAPVVTVPERAPAVVPPAPVAPPAPVVVPAATGDAAEHADRHDTDPQPIKTPAGPSAPGSTVGSAHDNTGGARGTQGVLVSHGTAEHPADAGFTTRSRAVNAAGRDAGLPASSPD